MLALALLLGACDSGSQNPSATPTVTTSSASASPSASELQLEAVARGYYEEASRAIATGKVERLRSLAIPQCSCQQLVRYIESKWANGSIRGGQFIIERVGPAIIEPKVRVVPVFRGVTAFEVLDRSGRVVERGPADPVIREDVYLRPVNGSWIVENIVVPK